MRSSTLKKFKRQSALLCLVAPTALNILLAAGINAQSINPAVIDPTAAYANKAYTDLAAGWWQYLMSLPTTNNPLLYDPAHPVIPISTGQSGPVWFIGGNFGYRQGESITNNYTNTVPGGIGLFLAIESVEVDNSDCPNPTDFSCSTLLSSIRSEEDDVTNITCTIDGVSLAGLGDALTTPYRVQACFDFTCPSLNNYVHDFESGGNGQPELCYSNNAGIPYSIQGAACDGVFLMIAPLSVGPHVIHYASWYQGFLIQDVTHYITVEPVTLTVRPSNQSGSLLLSWPQEADAYMLERSSTLDSPSWQPATNLPVVLTQRTFQVTTSVGLTNQFFRLRLN